jgi:thiol-disulfide isomerase/thioredoxin
MANRRKDNRNAVPGKMLALCIAGVVAVLLFWSYSRAVAEGMDWHRKSEMKMIAPDFVASDMANATRVPDFLVWDRFGNKVKLSQFSSVDLLIVNIWSEGCPVCREEVPELTEMDRRIGDLGNAALITIAIADKWEDVAGYFPKGTDLRVLFDPDDKIGKGIFGTVKYPETFILDSQRRIRARFDGKRPWYSEPMFDYLGTFM